MQDKTRTRYPCKYGPSQVAELTAVRESELGVFLDAETGNTSDDILLHKVQQTAPVKVGDRVRVFLYLDPKRRLTASMRTPRMKEGQVARLRVINVTKEGAFLDVGAERGIFLPYAGMRGRPQVGETVWAKLYTDKSGRLAVTMEVEDELRRASRPAEGVRVGDRLKGSVYNITERGIFLFTEERYIAFIDHREVQNRPRVGETVEIRVTYLREDGRLNASLRLPKEAARIEVRELLDRAARTVDLAATGRLVGLAGTITTVTAHALGLAEFDPEAIDGAELSVEDALASCDAIVHSTAAERESWGYLRPGRRDVIAAGALVWSEVIARVVAETTAAGRPLDRVRTSLHDILDGIALSLARGSGR